MKKLFLIGSMIMAFAFVACSSDDEPNATDFENVARSDTGVIKVDEEAYYYHNNSFFNGKRLDHSYYEIEDGITTLRIFLNKTEGDEDVLGNGFVPEFDISMEYAGNIFDLKDGTDVRDMLRMKKLWWSKGTLSSSTFRCYDNRPVSGSVRLYKVGDSFVLDFKDCTYEDHYSWFEDGTHNHITFNGLLPIIPK